jgi:hypothetical protein
MLRLEVAIIHFSKTSAMNIRFTSSLTPEHENVLASVLLSALANILDVLPIAYTIRIDTIDSHVYQHSGPVSRGGLDGKDGANPTGGTSLAKWSH